MHAYNNMVTFLQDQGKLEETMNAYSKATSLNPDKIKQLFDDGLTKAEIAKQLNISRTSVYRNLQG